jgi:hypothetical protein
MTKSRHHRTSRHVALAIAAAALGTLASVGTTAPVLSAPLHPTTSVREQLKETSDITEVRAVVRRGGAAVGPRGNAVVYRSRTVVRGPTVRGAAVVRPGYAGGGVRWARPGWYRWGPGGAIAAGAAIGFVAAGAALAYGTPPAPGMCWYYTDPSRTQGFWDYCPQ